MKKKKRRSKLTSLSLMAFIISATTMGYDENTPVSNSDGRYEIRNQGEVILPYNSQGEAIFRVNKNTRGQSAIWISPTGNINLKLADSNKKLNIYSVNEAETPTGINIFNELSSIPTINIDIPLGINMGTDNDSDGIYVENANINLNNNLDIVATKAISVNNNSMVNINSGKDKNKIIKLVGDVYASRTITPGEEDKSGGPSSPDEEFGPGNTEETGPRGPWEDPNLNDNIGPNGPNDGPSDSNGPNNGPSDLEGPDGEIGPGGLEETSGPDDLTSPDEKMEGPGISEGLGPESDDFSEEMGPSFEGITEIMSESEASLVSENILEKPIGSINIHLLNRSSFIKGNVIDEGNTSTLELANGAKWILKKGVEGPAGTQLTSKITNLELNSGIIDLTADLEGKLSIGNLKGNGGIFKIRTNIEDGKAPQIEIEKSSSGNHTISIRNMGGESGKYEPLLLVTADSKADIRNLNANFSLQHKVEIGAYEYDLGNKVTPAHYQWYLYPLVEGKNLI